MTCRGCGPSPDPEQDREHNDWCPDNPRRRKYLTFVMPDGAVWGVPVSRIAQHRARHYANDFGGDIERSLNEDTLPLFEANPAAIKDWATGDMDFDDVVDVVVRMSWPPKLTSKDFAMAWLGPKKLEER